MSYLEFPAVFEGYCDCTLELHGEAGTVAPSPPRVLWGTSMDERKLGGEAYSIDFWLGGHLWNRETNKKRSNTYQTQREMQEKTWERIESPRKPPQSSQEISTKQSNSRTPCHCCPLPQRIPHLKGTVYIFFFSRSFFSEVLFVSWMNLEEFLLIL